MSRFRRALLATVPSSFSAISTFLPLAVPASLLLAVPIFLLLAVPAGAHVVITPAEAPAGASARIAFMVGHGCAGAATTAIEVGLPEGLSTARPMPKPGWTIAVEMRSVQRPIPTEHGLLRQAPATIAWSGGLLPDQHYEEFVMLVATPNRPGETLVFPVIQRCEGGGQHAWVEVPAEGQRPRSPAATLRLGAR